MAIRGFIVRFNGKEAVLETPAGAHINLQRCDLPDGVQLGDFLEKGKDGDFVVNHKISEERRKAIMHLADRHFD